MCNEVCLISARCQEREIRVTALNSATIVIVTGCVEEIGARNDFLADITLVSSN